MDWSTKKKSGCLVMIGIAIIIVGGFFTYRTFFNAPQTCSDGIQNQDERCVDGGGICSRVCPMDAKTIVPLWSRAFPVARGVSGVVAYIENQNKNAGVKKINYEFRVYDSENILAGDPIIGSTFIGPNERTAIFESPIQTGNRIATNVFFKFTTAPDWSITDPKYQTPQLTSANVQWTDLTTSPKLSADIVNDTLSDYTNIPVVAILYDKDDNAINASQTIIDAIQQQTTQKVYFTWPQKFDREVIRVEIIPRLNPYEQNI